MEHNKLYIPMNCCISTMAVYNDLWFCVISA